MMFVFGLIGWLMSKLRFPTVLLLIGFILAPILERSARQTLILVDSSDGWIAFVQSRPVLMILLGVLGFLSVLVIRQRISMRRYAARDDEAADAS
jgi:putative tricarboxylic transport membrane protein